MKIKCEKCGFEEIPENFNGIMTYGTENEQLLRMIYIECPICNNQAFFQHFRVDTRNVLSVSHLLTPSLEEAKTPEEVKKKYAEKLKELRSKYSNP